MYTLHCRPKNEQACASAEPHWPAPVSVARRATLLLLVVVGLRHRRVRLVAPRRAHALVLVVDARRRIERLLEPPRAIERGGAPQAQDVAHLVGDLDPALLADLLLDQLHGEERSQILRPDRLAGARVQRRRQGRLEVGLDVVPAGGQLLLGEKVLGGHVGGLPSHGAVSFEIHRGGTMENGHHTTGSGSRPSRGWCAGVATRRACPSTRGSAVGLADAACG